VKKNIHHRCVFFIPGFDPRGVKLYYHLYKNQSALQAKFSGLELEISACKLSVKHIYEAEVSSSHDTGETQTKLNFLEWNDIVRRFWPKTLKDKCLGFMNYLKFMANHPVTKIPPTQYAVLGVPFLFVIGTLCSFIGLELLFNSMIESVPNELLRLLLRLFAFAVGLLIFPLMLRLTKKIGIAWLTNSYAFTHQWAEKPDTRFQERIHYFASAIVKAIENKDFDEIQVVAHSSGSLLAIVVMAEVLTQLDARLDLIEEKRLALITLGACIPVLYLHEKAAHYRQALHKVRDQPNLFWLDFTDTTDFVCYPLWDLGRKHRIKTACIRIISINFRRLYSRQSFKKVELDLFALHFLYLMANEVPGQYDYFFMTAGPLSAKDFLVSRQFDIFYAYSSS